MPLDEQLIGRRRVGIVRLRLFIAEGQLVFQLSDLSHNFIGFGDDQREISPAEVVEKRGAGGSKRTRPTYGRYVGRVLPVSPGTPLEILPPPPHHGPTARA